MRVHRIHLRAVSTVWTPRLIVTPVKDTDPEAVAALNGLRYPSPDAQLGEHLYPDEKTIANKLSVVIEESVRKQYSAGTARRDAHPKAHGCVKAEIRIDDTLPAALSKMAGKQLGVPRLPSAAYKNQSIRILVPGSSEPYPIKISGSRADSTGRPRSGL